MLQGFENIITAIRDWVNFKFQPKGNYSLIENTGYSLSLNIDSDYIMTIGLKNADGDVLSEKSIDFPIESMVIGADYADGVITLTLQNGQTLEVDVSALVNGLVNDAFTIAGIDMKDDITKEELATALGIGDKLDKDGDASETTVIFSQATERENIVSGEKSSVILGKIKKFFADLKPIAFSGKTSDLTNDSGFVTDADTIPVSNGGTGQTTAQDALNALINSLSSGTATPKDTDYYVSQYAGGENEITTYHRRPVSSLWNYIKSKLSSGTGAIVWNVIAGDTVDDLKLEWSENGYGDGFRVYGGLGGFNDANELHIQGSVGGSGSDKEYKDLMTVTGKSGNVTVLGYVKTSSDTSTLGTAEYKWDAVYAKNGTIQTSDLNEKNDIKELSLKDAQDLIMGLGTYTYKMNNGTANRYHWGMISQYVEELLNELGWDSAKFAGFIKSPKTIIVEEEEYEDKDENGNTVIKSRTVKKEQIVEGEYNYSLRYDEFIAPMIKVIQSQNERIKALEEKLKLLE